MRITGFEDDSGVHVGNAARAVEHLPRAESLPQQEQALALKIGDFDGAPAGQRVAGRHGGEGPYREQQAPVKVIVASPEGQGEMDFPPLDEACGANSALLDEVDVNARA